MTRLTLLAVLALAVWSSVLGEPEAAEDVREPGYLRAPVLPGRMVEATPSPTAVTFLAELSWYSCDVEQGTAACIEAHTGNRAGPGTAASNTLPAGTWLTIDGERYEIRDFCSACRSSGIDLWAESRDVAIAKGRKSALVTIEE